jgi:hypothetical protein
MPTKKYSTESGAASTSLSAAATTDRDNLVDASQASAPEASRSEDKHLKTVEVGVEQLVEAGWNPNRLSAKLLVKLRRSISEFGVVQNLVVRPHPDGSGRFEVLSGNQRLRVYRELGFARAAGRGC